MVTETEPTKVELFGFEDSDVTEEPVTLRPNRFRPEAGIRNRLRNRLHEVLEEEALDDDSEENDGDERTVSRYTFYRSHFGITNFGFRLPNSE